METKIELPAAPSQGTLTMFNLLRGQDRPSILTAADQAYEWIWRQQLFLPGETPRRLSDVTLAAQLQISRTPVRQALDRLSQEGLINFDPRRGYWTRVFTAQDVNEIYELREANEALALRLALPRLRKEDLLPYLETIHSLRAMLPDVDEELFIESDFQLHSFLINLCGNGRLIRYLATLRTQAGLFQLRDVGYAGRVESALDDHEEFLNALLEGKEAEAVELLAEHIRHAKAHVLDDMFPEVSKKKKPSLTRETTRSKGLVAS